MIEKTVTRGPHILYVETRRRAMNGRALADKEWLCNRTPPAHTHETYRCAHGERTWCIGPVPVSQAEVQEVLHARFGCDCA